MQNGSDMLQRVHLSVFFPFPEKNNLKHSLVYILNLDKNKVASTYPIPVPYNIDI